MTSPHDTSPHYTSPQGRNIEVPSEDPYHSGAYGAAVVRGVQWGKDSKYTKINAALKHFWAYSMESGRGHSNFEISAHDIADTYLPSFEAPIVESDAKGYMCR
jgi:beta-glucosidase-like glycosyl hydrolase